jgi:hypothetical protein
MSHHINLYDPTLLQRKQWLSAANLLLAVALLSVILFAWGSWKRIQAGALTTEAATLADQTKAAREESIALAAQLANRKPDPKLELDLAAMKELLGVRQEILTALGQGQGPVVGGYAEYLRGLARQTVSGLWLTGFAVGADGARMEIRGRTLDPARLPEYIRRLNAEPAFRGHRFAALSVSAPTPAGAPPGPSAAPEAVQAAPPFLEFALMPDLEPRRAGEAK